ncbi:MAG: hypothetical protein ACMV0K_04345, partial [Sulfurospirillum sp.]
RLYEALIARITLSMFTYNLLSYINRIKHEPQTLGQLFRNLECELETLAISMQLFIILQLPSLALRLTGMPVIARLPNNKLIWNFKGKYNSTFAHKT